MERTRNALDLALSKIKNLEAHKAVAEYESKKKTVSNILLQKQKEYQELLKKAKEAQKELDATKKRIKGLTIRGVRDELNKQTNSSASELPPEPVCKPCNCSKEKP